MTCTELIDPISDVLLQMVIVYIILDYLIFQVDGSIALFKFWRYFLVNSMQFVLLRHCFTDVLAGCGATLRL
uniref:Uncharacterized protein n=1 Tax=Physcomitrium patens TaxID=3218 RepID=A0A7I4EXU7_PHYPA